MVSHDPLYSTVTNKIAFDSSIWTHDGPLLPSASAFQMENLRDHHFYLPLLLKPQFWCSVEFQYNKNWIFVMEVQFRLIYPQNTLPKSSLLPGFIQIF